MKGSIKKFISVILITAVIAGQSFAGIEVIKRDEAGENYKWDLSEIYDTEEEFFKDMKAILNDEVPKLAAYKGKLNNSDDLLKFFELDEKVSRDLIKGYVFANLSIDLDQSNSSAEKMAGYAGMVYSEYANATSFLSPELLKLDEANFNKLVEDEKLSEYKSVLENLLRKKEHILSDKEERIIALASELTSAPDNIYDKVTLADFKKATIVDKDGEEQKLSGSVYYKIMKGDDREARKEAYFKRIQSYEDVVNTLSAVYKTEINKNIFLSKARGYDSSIEASLSNEQIPRSIYDNLVSSVNKNMDPLHKYYEIKKKALGLDEMHGYDLGVPLVDDYKVEMSFDDAVDMIAKALAPLGDKYVNDFKQGIADNWVDVYEDDNKYTGGYQWGTYDTHPYILMNYDNTLDSVLTLAHEMGHALNSKYSNEAQTYTEAGYPIFTAEVASTVNELLVMDYLIKNAKNDTEKLYLVNKQIGNISGTMYTQVMFSEFEQIMHDKAESGEALSPESFNQIWLSLIMKYNGPAVKVDKETKVGWTRIPHFYMNFYVYKYATSMSASYQIVNNISSGDQKATEDYLTFLASGGSKTPVDTLLAAGVDMNSSKPVDSLLAYFDELVNEMDDLLNKEVAMDTAK